MEPEARHLLIAVKSVREVTWLVNVALSLVDPGSRVDVVHVGEPDPVAYRAGEEAVDEAIDELRVHGIDATGHVLPSGRPVDDILGLADEVSATIVVIGAGGAHALGLGSTAREVARRTDRPVVVVPMSARLPRTRLARVLVAIGDEEEASVMVSAVRLLGVRQVVLAHVPRRVAVHAGGHPYAEIPETSEDTVRESLLTMRHAGFSATHVSTRDGLGVGDAIEEAAERAEADVIAVASTRPSPLRSLFTGSAGFAIVARAQRPVLFAPVHRLS